MPKTTTTPVAQFRLEDLDVLEVSVVDQGANLRPLLIVKNATPTDPVVAAQAAKAAESTSLIVTLPVELRDELAGMLGDVATRVSALGEAVKAAAPGDGGVSDKFKAEMFGLSTVLRRVAGLDKSGKINDLDKTALADGSVIDPTGLPRVPKVAACVEYVMTPEGPAMRLPPGEMLKVALRFAIDALYKAEDALYYCEDVTVAVACLLDCMKALGPFVSSAGALDLAKSADQVKDILTKQYAFNQPQPSIATGVPQAQTGAADPPGGNGQGSSADLTKAQMGGMLAAAQTMLKSMQQPAAAPVATAPAEVPSQSAAEVALGRMLVVLKNLKAENDTLRATRPTGNAGAEPDPQPSTPPRVIWPDDLTTDLGDEE